MAATPQDAAQAHALLADTETAAAELHELHELHDAIGDAALHAAAATVGVLSLLPFLASDERAVGFLTDVMRELGDTVSRLARCQAHGIALVQSSKVRADAIRDDFSVRV